jgi:hypothetical protein
MKKRLFLLLALIFPALAYGQNSNYQQILLGSTGRPVAGAQVTICSAGATGIPCSPTVNIYNADGSAASNPIISDSLGNWGFWAPPGNYTYTVTGLNVTSHGPFTISLPCIVGASCASAGGLPNSSVAFSATPSFAASSNASYSMTLTGNITAITITGTPINGNLLRFQFTQDATGGRTVTWPGNFSIPTSFAFKSVPNSTNRVTFVYDGTNWQMLEDIPDGALDYSTVAFSSTPTFSNARSAAFDFTLSGNVTSSTFSTTGRAGTIFNLNACENGTGGFTFAFPGNVTNPPGFSFDTAAGHCNYLTYRYSGSAWTPISTGGSGGGGGTPCTTTTGALQRELAGAFGCSNVSESGTTLRVNDDIQAKGPNPYFDITNYGGYVQNNSSIQNTTANTTVSSTTVTLASAIDFANGQGIVINGAGSLPTIPNSPTVGTVTPLYVTGGSTTRSYEWVGEDYSGGLKAAGTAGTSAATAATLGINTISITGVVRSGGLDTFTCATNCNVAIGSPIQISGFSGGSNSTVNGSMTVNTIPTSTTFTVYAQGLADYTESASATMQVRACNALFPSGTLTQEATVLRYWVYRQDNGAGNYNLVGVVPGQDPFYIDCGQGVSGQPSYVPSTAPAADIPGYLATTIVSGGGTTSLVVANAAGTSVSGQTAQHDNSQVLRNLLGTVYSAHGGIIRFPVLPSNSTLSFPFNATTNLQSVSNSTSASVRIEVSAITLNQPIAISPNSEWTGIPQVGYASFGYSTYGSIGGAASPMFIFNTAMNSWAKVSKIKFAGSSTGHTSIISDEKIGGGGNVGLIFEDVVFSGNNAPTAIIKGGFDFWFIRGQGSVSGSENATWYASPIIRLTNVSSYVTTSGSQLPGRITIDHMNLAGGTGIQFDNLPASNEAATITNGGLNLIEYSALHELSAGPHIRVNTTSSAYGIFLIDPNFADQTNGLHQPIVELTGTTLFNHIVVSGAVAGGGNPTILGGGSQLGAICLNNVFTQGCGPSPNTNIQGSTSLVDAGVFQLINGASMGAQLPNPTGTCTAVVSAGGSVPVGTHTYAIAWADRNPVVYGNGTVPYAGITLFTATCSATTSGGNQTVTITRPSIPATAYGWVVARDGAVAADGGGGAFTVPIPAATSTFADTHSFTSGQSLPGVNTAFISKVDSTGVIGPLLKGGGLGGNSTSKTGNYTLLGTDFLIYADPTGGAFTITLPHAIASQVWSVINPSSSANVLTVQPDSGLIDGSASTTVPANAAKFFSCDGTNCRTLATTGGGGGGTGTINNASQYSLAYYSAAGTTNTVSGIPSPTTNGIYSMVYNVSGGVAVAPSTALSGVPKNVQTGNYTLLYSDRAGDLLFNSCTTPTLTLPAISGNLASNMPFKVTNNCSGNLTITATSPNTIDGGAAGGSITLFPGWAAFITQDNAPNWFSLKFPTISGVPTSCTAITGNASTGIQCAVLPVVSGVNSQTVTYTAVAGDNGKIVSMNGSSITLNLPASPPASPWGIFVENLNASTLTVNRNGLNIDGVASNITLAQNTGLWVTTDGSNYFTSRGVGSGSGGLGDPGGNGIVVRTALNTTTNRSIATADSTHITVTNADGTAGNPTLDIGTNVVTPSSTNTLTNKTLDAEGTGNVITVPFKIYQQVAACNNATAGVNLDLPTANAPTANCLTGTNTQQGTLDFGDSANTTAQWEYRLPSDWSGNLDITIDWLVTASGGSNAVKWTVATACSAPAATYDTAFNTAQTITTNVGANNSITESTQTALTTTGCSAGNILHLKIGRDTTDTFTGTARLYGFELTLRRAM